MRITTASSLLAVVNGSRIKNQTRVKRGNYTFDHTAQKRKGVPLYQKKKRKETKKECEETTTCGVRARVRLRACNFTETAVREKERQRGICFHANCCTTQQQQQQHRQRFLGHGKFKGRGRSFRASSSKRCHHPPTSVQTNSKLKHTEREIAGFKVMTA